MLRRTGLSMAAGAVALLAVGPATVANAAPRGTPYHAVAGELLVTDVAEQTTDYAASWRGDGTRIEGMQESDEELPPLPVALIPGKKNDVAVLSDVIMEGDEMLINAEGNTVACSGDWRDEVDGYIRVQLKANGNKLQATWRIPSNLASRNCGIVYNQFENPYLAKGTAAGQIGDKRIVLKSKGEKVEQELQSRGVLTQTLGWEGRVVLKRAKVQGPPKPPG
jgi:hypothetical protein